jgi:hypothetical protein
MTSNGLASPMKALTLEVRNDGEVAFSFDPPDLERTWVCEYYHGTGYSGREMMLQYLSKYSMCFSVVQKTETEYVIRPNPNNSPEMKKTKLGWFCRCNESQVPK